MPAKRVFWDPMDERDVCCTKAVSCVHELVKRIRLIKAPPGARIGETVVAVRCRLCDRVWERKIDWPEGAMPVLQA